MTGRGADHRGRSVPRGHLWRDRPQAVVLALGMTVQAALVLHFARHTWFTADAWYYVSRRGLVPQSDLGLFEPYAGHWQTVPILLFRTMFATVGIGSYWPYLLLALLLHFTICVLLYVLMVRLGLSRIISAVATWLVVFYGYGAESFTGDGPIPLTLTLVLGLLAMLLGLSVGPHVARREPGRSYLIAAMVGVAVLLVLGVMTSALGLVTSVWVALAIALHGPGWRWATVVVAPAALAFLVWFVAVGHHGDRIQANEWSLPGVIRFAWTGLTTSLETAAGLSFAGALLLVLLVGVMVGARDVPSAARGVAALGLLAALLQMCLVAVGTPTAIGLYAAEQPRYTYVALVFLTPAVALALSVLTRDRTHFLAEHVARPTRLLLAGVLLAGITTVGLIRERQFVDLLTENSTVFRVWVLGSMAAVDSGSQVLVPHPVSPYLQKIDMRLLTDASVAARLPGARATDEQRLSAEIQFFTYVGPDSPGLAPPGAFRVEGLRRLDRPAGSCQAYWAEGRLTPVALVFPAGTALRVTSPSRSVTAELTRGAERSEVRTWAVTPGSLFVASSAQAASVRVTFDGLGEYRVCGA